MRVVDEAEEQADNGHGDQYREEEGGTEYRAQFAEGHVFQNRRQHKTAAYLDDDRDDSVADVVKYGGTDDLILQHGLEVLQADEFLFRGKGRKLKEAEDKVLDQRQVYEYRKHNDTRRHKQDRSQQLSFAFQKVSLQSKGMVRGRRFPLRRTVIRRTLRTSGGSCLQEKT